MAGTITFVHDKRDNVRRVIATCTADAADGSFPNIDLPRIDGRLVALRTNPSAVTAPQANYDITLIDEDGVDRLQGVGANRHTANSEEALVVYTGTAIHPACSIAEVLSLRLAGNNVNSAVTVVTLVYVAA